MNNDLVGVSGTYSNVTLSSGNWTASGQYNLTGTYPSATYDLIIGPASTITSDQYNALLKAKLICNPTANILIALGDKPTVNIPVTIFAKTKKTA